MGKYDVTFACGHTGEVELFGAHKDRESKIAWMQEHKVCPACYAKQQAERLEASGAAAVEMKYGEYKNHYANCKTKPGSYNVETKTIIVYVPADATATTTQEAPSNEDLAISEMAAGGIDARTAKRLVSMGSAAVAAMLEKVTAAGCPATSTPELYEAGKAQAALAAKVLARYNL